MDAGRAAFSAQQWAAAARAFRAALSAPDAEAAADRHHIVHANIAAALLKAGDAAGAEAAALHCVALNPSSVKGFYRLALARKRLGKADALAAAQRAAELDAADPEIRALLRELSPPPQQQCVVVKHDISDARAVLLSADDLAVRESVPSPVMAMLGIPIRVHRRLRVAPSAMLRTASLDNQVATYLMIEPSSGFAPAFWQSNVGEVVISRGDGRALEEEHVYALWEFFCQMLDAYGEGPGGREAVARMKTRPWFDRWLASYNARQAVPVAF